MEVTAEVLAQRILPLLPQDGTPVLNRVMRVMLSRQLEIQIEPDLYFAARDLLLEKWPSHGLARLPCRVRS
jgi:hypothetical protein